MMKIGFRQNCSISPIAPPLGATGLRPYADPCSASQAPSNRNCVPVVKVVFALLLLPCVLAAEDDLFTQRIAPLLQEKCLSCHNPQKKEGELDLSTREVALKGGENGPA